MDPLYSPPRKYAWDFWLVRQDREYHLFHLQASRSLPAEARHLRATVGHAVSRDLKRWTYRGTILAPGKHGEWDDRSIWTGSILPHRGRYYLIYTALRRSDQFIQRIGLAVSDDLERWEKHPANPVLAADPRWYETRWGGPLRVEDWRDPYLYEEGGKIHAFITARTRVPGEVSPWRLAGAYAQELLYAKTPLGNRGYPPGPLSGRGCIAHATSLDFVRWEVGPPVFSPGKYQFMECPQVVRAEGRTYLLFSALRGLYTREWARECGGGQTGAHAYCARDLRGPWSPVNGSGVVLGTRSGCYGTKLVEGRDGGWVALSWLERAPGRAGFCGRISRPRPVRIEGERIRISGPPAG